MKTIFHVIFFLFFINIIYSQPVTWQKWYDYNDLEDNGQDVIQTFEGGYSVLTNNYVGLNGSSIIRKLDEHGNVDWLKVYDRSIMGGTVGILCNSIAQTSDSGFVVSGQSDTKALLFKINKVGEIQWIKKYLKPQYTSAFFLDHKVTAEGNILACGTMYNPSIGYLLKTDSVGNIVWDTLLNITTDIIQVLESHDNSIYLLGYGTTLIKTTAAGKLIWEKNLFLPNRVDLVEHSSKNIFVSGGLDSMILYKIDTSGTTIFQKSYFVGVHGCRSMCLTLEGNILLAGAVDFQNNLDMAVSKIRPDGNLIFDRIITFTNQTNFTFLPEAVSATFDNGFIFTGFTNFPPNFHESNTYVTKTDSLCYAPLSVGVSNTNSTIPNDFQLQQNFPNPFNPSTTISYQILKPGFVRIGIFDLKGSKICNLLNEYQSSGSHKINFNSDFYNLGSGLYFCTVTYRYKTENIKMILIR